MDIDTGATAWVLVSTALVLLMTPAVGLFYGGLVRKKNVIAMIALSLVAFAIVCVQWITLGYTLAFGADIQGVIGDLSHLGLTGIGFEPLEGMAVPGILFAAFQMVFACLTLAILCSGFAERIKLSGFLLFGLLWTTLVYDPLAHWMWGGGFASMFGALDFAGGTVVHISSGFGALAVALVIGKRIGFGEHTMEPANVPMTLLGAALLIVGWLGFNGGSALAADGLAASALMVSIVAASAGALAWMAAAWAYGKPSSLGIASGFIAGLVGITPAAGFVSVTSAVIIGALSGIVCYAAMLWRIRKGYDESLDAWAIHGVGGLLGAILTGVFAAAAIGGTPGLLEGNVSQFFIQIGDALLTVVYVFVVTYILALIVDKTIGLRVRPEEEYVGLDISQYGERVQ